MKSSFAINEAASKITVTVPNGSASPETFDINYTDDSDTVRINYTSFASGLNWATTASLSKE